MKTAIHRTTLPGEAIYVQDSKAKICTLILRKLFIPKAFLKMDPKKRCPITQRSLDEAQSYRENVEKPL